MSNLVVLSFKYILKNIQESKVIYQYKRYEQLNQYTHDQAESIIKLNHEVSVYEDLIQQSG